jgi:signal transduction histidine kinase
MNTKALKFQEAAGILKAMLDDIPTAVLVLDRNIVVRMHNKAFQVLFVEPGQHTLGKYCGNAMNCSFAIAEGCDCGGTSSCSRCNLRNSFIQTLARKEINREKISKAYYLADKIVTRHFYYTTKYINFEDEEMIMVLIDDITELEEKNRILSELNEKKNSFMQIAAHDIRNPISSIFTFSDLLISSKKELPEKKQEEFLLHIKNSASFSIQLLNDLLDLSVLESGGAKLNVRLNDYTDLINHITETYHYIAASKKITVTFFSHLRIREMYFDSNRIEQVLHNLLSNAVKYSPSGSEITITLSKTKNFITTCIADQGPGIKEEDTEKIFKPFHKTAAKATGGEKSTGLGLSICKLIVQQHGGNIWVETNKSKGASFCFSIPYKTASSET